jgi:hypothetical protein
MQWATIHRTQMKLTRDIQVIKAWDFLSFWELLEFQRPSYYRVGFMNISLVLGDISGARIY